MMEQVAYCQLENGERVIFYDWNEEKRKDILYKKVIIHDEEIIDLIKNWPIELVKQQIDFILDS